MGDDFNVGNPTKQNIEYAFKNLLFYVLASAHLNIYKEYRESFNQIFNKINLIFSKYIENENLEKIGENELQDLKFDLVDLDADTKNLNSYYAEWSLMWIEAIISLKMSEIRMSDSY